MLGRTLMLIGTATVVAACGGQSSHPSSKVEPREVVLTAVQRTTESSFRFDLQEHETFAATGPGAGSFSSLAGKDVTIQMHADAQNASRVRATVTAGVAGKEFSALSVVYDGTAYLSTDGGALYHAIVVPSSVNQLGAGTALQYLKSIGTVTDEGPGTSHGEEVERYHAAFDPQKLTSVMQSLIGSLGGSAQSLAGALNFTGGSVEVTVDSTGHLMTEDGTLNMTLDLGAVSQQLQGTTLTVGATVHGYFYDYGASITVTKPTNITASATNP
jgi:hypothetical protein